jgi:hypothetical protein
VTQSTLSVTAEPSKDQVVHYLPLAATAQGVMSLAQINLVLQIANSGPDPIHITAISLSVRGSVTPAKKFNADISVPVGQSRGWTQDDDYLVGMVEEPKLKLMFDADGLASPITITKPLAPHSNPTPEGCYRFWARLDDLRIDEFWHVHGTSHGQSNPAQLFAHDVGVSAPDPNNNDKYSALLPGTDGSMNEHYRIWGKPIHAIAAGEVVDFRNDFPTNQVPGQIDPQAEAYWQGGSIVDGNGNFFTITTGDETVLYAHMQPGTLNRRLLAKGAQVKAGDFLGLAGNSGASSAPHMHIHANQAGSGNHSWTGNPRPLLFRDVHEVAFTAYTGDVATTPWVKVDRRGLAGSHCAVWPSAMTPTRRASPALRHFALNAEGQLWIVKSNGPVRTSHTRLPDRGAYLDIDPAGMAKEVAVRGRKPYLLASDDRIWEGKPEGWFPLPASPVCIRLTLDAANGKPWVLRDDNHILHFDVDTRSWFEHSGNGRGKDICIANGTAHVIGMDDRVWQSKGANGWAPLEGDQTGVRLTSDPDSGQLWILTSDGQVLRHIGSGKWKAYAGVPGVKPNNLPKDLAVLEGKPYIIGPNNRLWMGNAGWGWSPIHVTAPF